MGSCAGSSGKTRRRWSSLGIGAWGLLWLLAQPLPAQSGPPAETIPPLLGTVAGAGPDSQALFGAGDRFAWVTVGQEVATGFRLVQVNADRVTVLRESTGQEIHVSLGSGGPSTGDFPPPTASSPETSPPATSPRDRVLDVRSMSPGELARLNAEIKEKFERARAADPAETRVRGNGRGTRGEAPEEE